MKRIVVIAGLVSLVLSACSLSPISRPTERVNLDTQAQAVAGNRIVAFGDIGPLTTELSAPPPGVFYTKVTKSQWDIYALRSDGQIITRDFEGWCEPFTVPTPPAGLRYIDLDTEPIYQNVALRSDGQVLSWGDKGVFTCESQDLYGPDPKDSLFVAVAAGGRHALALRSDGTVYAWGANDHGQTDVPALPSGLRYTAVEANWKSSFALRSDGKIVSWGDGNWTFPVLPAGVTYTAISASAHVIALRSDGQAVALGDNQYGQLAVPALPTGVIYTSATAGVGFSLFVRSDGRIVSSGKTVLSSEPIPSLTLPFGSHYVAAYGGMFGAAMIVVDPPSPSSYYTIDLESLTSGSVVNGVALGQGVVANSFGKTPVKGNTRPIEVVGQTPGSNVNQARVFGKTTRVLFGTTNNILTVGGKLPSTTGGSLRLSFVPSFNAHGVTVTSFKLFSGAQTTLTVYGVDGSSKPARILIPPAPGIPSSSPRTIRVNAVQVEAIEVSSPGAFAVDDIVFGEARPAGRLP